MWLSNTQIYFIEAGYFSVAWLYCEDTETVIHVEINDKKDDPQCFCYSNSCDCSGGCDREETSFQKFERILFSHSE